ncbi:MAG: SRPBCC family protein [Thermoleophilaceae bacterium]|nr:SRPBCC family protein [Thermoleophilaceae bacterium]
MADHVLEREQILPTAIEQAFAFFADASNLEALTPPWLHFRIVGTGETEMAEGALIEYRLRLHGIPIRWRTRIEEWRPTERFVDRQIRGPYVLWHHTHTFREREGRTEMRDLVRYRLPLGPLGEIGHRMLVRRDLERIFDYRRDTIVELLANTS